MTRPPDRRRLLDLAVSVCVSPGSGWATSRSGYAPLAEDLHRSMFGIADTAAVGTRWRAQLDGLHAARVAVLGVPYGQGSYGPCGAAMGPLGVRSAWSTSRRGSPGVVDVGDVPFFPGPPLDEMLSSETLAAARQSRYGDAGSRHAVCMLSLHAQVARECSSARLPLLSIGGDHSITASSLIGLNRPGIGLVHLDAHPDLSDGRDGLELLHNSWIRFADRRAPIGHLVQVGPTLAMSPAWMDSRLTSISADAALADPEGTGRAVADALSRAHVGAAFVSIDIDVINSVEAPATGLPGGPLSTACVVALVRELGRRVAVVGADITEVAPPASAASLADEATCRSAATLADQLVRMLSFAD